MAARKALGLGQEVGAPALIGAAWRTLGILSAHTGEAIAIEGNEWRDAEACFAQSARIFTEMGAEGELAQTWRAWATSLIESGDRARGKAIWQKARDLFERLGMDLQVESMAQPPLDPNAERLSIADSPIHKDNQ